MTLVWTFLYLFSFNDSVLFARKTPRPTFGKHVKLVKIICAAFAHKSRGFRIRMSVNLRGRVWDGRAFAKMKDKYRREKSHKLVCASRKIVDTKMLHVIKVFIGGLMGPWQTSSTVFIFSSCILILRRMIQCWFIFARRISLPRCPFTCKNHRLTEQTNFCVKLRSDLMGWESAIWNEICRLQTSSRHFPVLAVEFSSSHSLNLDFSEKKQIIIYISLLLSKTFFFFINSLLLFLWF